MKSPRKDLEEKYNIPGRHYDHQRDIESKGKILSEYDIKTFLSLLMELAQSCEVHDALEIGAGTGRFTMPTLSRLSCRVTATDINETLLETLREKVNTSKDRERCIILREDMFNLSFAPSSFDLVCCTHVIPRLSTLTDQREALREISRVLRPGGNLLFNYRNSSSLYGAFHNDFAPNSSQMDEVLRQEGFRIIRRKGKWLTTRRTLDILPILAGKWLIKIDSKMHHFLPRYAWDVFVLAEKHST